MAKVINPFPGAALGWGISQHLSNGYGRYPGEDLRVGSGLAIRAPMSGRLTRPERLPGESPYARIVAPDGTVVIIREIGLFLGPVNANVVAGDTLIGRTSAKWPHFEVWMTSVAVSFLEKVAQSEPSRPDPPTSTKNRHNNMQKLWLYNNSQYIVVDHLNMTYRTIPSGSLEHLAIQNDVNAGFARWDAVNDPDWGKNFGNGQFRAITTPVVAGTIDPAPIKAAAAAGAAEGVSSIKIPTAAENGAAARAAIIK